MPGGARLPDWKPVRHVTAAWLCSREVRTRVSLRVARCRAAGLAAPGGVSRCSWLATPELLLIQGGPATLRDWINSSMEARSS